MDVVMVVVDVAMVDACLVFLLYYACLAVKQSATTAWAPTIYNSIERLNLDICMCASRGKERADIHVHENYVFT